MKYQIIVIGAGPAGISAAINAKILQRSVLLVGDSLGSQKTKVAPQVLNYLGLPQVDGETLNQAFVNHLSALGVEFLKKRVHGVYPSGEEFLVDVGGDFLTAESVILACGVSSTPTIKNEQYFLGKGVSYCATCDAPLLKGKTACVLGYDEESVAETNYIATLCDEVLFLAMGNFKTSLNPSIKKITAKPISFEGDQKATTLVTNQGEIKADGFFVLKQLSASTVVHGIKAVKNHVKTDKKCRTNLKGIFAAGDVTGKPYKYQKSAGEGLVAAFSADEYLSAKQKRPS